VGKNTKMIALPRGRVSITLDSINTRHFDICRRSLVEIVGVVRAKVEVLFQLKRYYIYILPKINN
jgi:hypothetical protein